MIGVMLDKNCIVVNVLVISKVYFDYQIKYFKLLIKYNIIYAKYYKNLRNLM